MKGLRLFKAALTLAAALFPASFSGAATVAERADAIFLDMLGAVSAVRDYEARFMIQRQVAGRIRMPETIQIKQRRQPSCLHANWLSGPKVNTAQVLCSDAASIKQPVRKNARTLMNQKRLSRAQLNALKVVLQPIDDDGLFGLVARYANQYFDAAEHARPGDFIVEVRRATVFERTASCLRIRRRQPIADAPFTGQSEICVDDRSKLPSAFRSWDIRNQLVISYMIGSYRVNPGLTDNDFSLRK